MFDIPSDESNSINSSLISLASNDNNSSATNQSSGRRSNRAAFDDIEPIVGNNLINPIYASLAIPHTVNQEPTLDAVLVNFIL